ncbi:MAG: 30S ribosome-binding factor RbfA [Candidatus Glassbacteria bacterium]
MTNNSYKRSDRLGHQLQREIGKVLQFDVRDPRLQFVTITEVRLSADLMDATVFVSIMGENREEVFNRVEHAGSFIRSRTAQRCYLKFVPRLNFKLDTTLETAARIENLIDQVCGGDGRDATAGNEPR